MKKVLIAVLAVVMVATCVGILAACNDKPVVKVIEIKLTDEEYAFGVDKEQSELLDSINNILDAMQTDGSFQKIMDKYFNGEEVEGITSATFDASKADKQLVVATNAEFEPFEYKVGNKFAGIDMEIAKVIADKLEMELVIMDMDFDSVVTSVGANGVDVGMAALTVSEDRKKSVNFTKSYYKASQVAIVKVDDKKFDDCKTAEDVEAVLKASAMKAGFQNGTTGEGYVTGSVDMGFEGFSNIEPKGYDNAGLAVKDLIDGKIDVVITDEAPANAIVKSYNGKK